MRLLSGVKNAGRISGVIGCKERRADQRRDRLVEIDRTLVQRPQQIFGRDDPRDIIDTARPKHREARMAGLREAIEELANRRVVTDRDHLGTWQHRLIGRPVGEGEDIDQHLLFLGLQRAGLTALLDQQPQLLGGMNLGMTTGILHTKEA